MELAVLAESKDEVGEVEHVVDIESVGVPLVALMVEGCHLVGELIVGDTCVAHVVELESDGAERGDIFAQCNG